ncbi:MAG: GTP-binding protein [Clostridia bacterium]|jgi:G3E family GTPase|nr:GTP-binding protein [Clostridia bacterium]MDD4543167.1 GTP-binding protein [Clostridia bacterium]NLF37629.1 hypothetical protein [Clostridiaceae bacterium]
MDKTKVAVIGGFLGSGKTTLILNLAKSLIKDGLSVGIVTNDQGSDLIDAKFLSSNGLDVTSVKGKCFCCFFDDLASKLSEFRNRKAADILLLEPVGSAINLVSTIFKPFVNNRSVMLDSFNEGFILSPLVVLADPKRVRHLMMSEQKPEYTTPVSYLFSKQLEEADLILINKKDTINEQEQADLKVFLESKYPNTEIKTISALDNDFVNDIKNFVLTGSFVLNKSIEVDYVKYTDVEASLSWLNSNAFVKFEEVKDINKLMDKFMNLVRDELVESKSSIAHMKCYAVADEDFYKASITSNTDSISVNNQMRLEHDSFNIIINARIISSPITLKSIFESNLKQIFNPKSINTESFSPKYPKPNYCE